MDLADRHLRPRVFLVENSKLPNECAPIPLYRLPGILLGEPEV